MTFRPVSAQELQPMLEAFGPKGLGEGVLPEESRPLLELTVVRTHANHLGLSADEALVSLVTGLVALFEPPSRKFLQARLGLGVYQGQLERNRNAQAAQAITGNSRAAWQNVSRAEARRVFALLAGKLFDKDGLARQATAVDAAEDVQDRANVETQQTSSIQRLGLADAPGTETVGDREGRPRLFVFGGISGTGVGHIANAWQQRAPNRAAIHFEERLLQHARSNYSRLTELAARPSNRDLSFHDVIRLPEPVLVQLWLETFEQVAIEIRHEDRDVDTALVMHGTYYHLGSTAYTCAITHQAIHRLADLAVQVVCFVDDLFDVHTRLTRLLELYYGHGNALAALESLARWRTAETNALSQVARTLESPFAVLATKHPISVLEALSQHPGRGIYLSHPISAPRELGLLTPAAQELQEEVAILAASLRRSMPFAVYEPTTIDEFRFDVDDDDALRSGRLLPRWREPRQVETVERAETLADADPLSADERAAADHVLVEVLATKPRIANLAQVESLRRELRRQVIERDHQLDRQADIIVAFKPAWSPNGAVADGVRAELEYADQLVACGFETWRSALIIHSETDEHRRRVAALSHVLDEHQGLFLLRAGRVAERQAELDEFVRAYPDSQSCRSVSEIDLAEDLYKRLALAQSIDPKTVHGFHIGVMRNETDYYFVQQPLLLAQLGTRIRAALFSEFAVQASGSVQCHQCHRPISVLRHLPTTEYEASNDTFWADLQAKVADVINQTMVVPHQDEAHPESLSP